MTKLLAPILVLSCLAVHAEAADLWVPCATEGQTCSFGGEHQVRYGVRGKRIQKKYIDAAVCNAATFGGDPAPGAAKTCEVMMPETWAACATENGQCAFTGEREVRYGGGGKWATKKLNGGTPCTNAVFGDPAKGVKKTCEIIQTEFWLKCAGENQQCKFNGAREVRYGGKGKFAQKSFTNVADCSNKTFGDPAPGVQKICEVKELGVADPKPFTTAAECTAALGQGDEATACQHCVARVTKSAYDSLAEAGKRCHEVAK